MKNFLLLGASGSGKSTVANSLTDSEFFKVSEGSVSETKTIQTLILKDDSNSQIIDTPGLGDTGLSSTEVLDVIAKAVYLVKDGVDQVLFVINGRFSQFEISAYNIIRTIIFDEKITNHTTIVRTSFPKFSKKEECRKDLVSMIEESSFYRKKIEKEVLDKRVKVRLLSKDSDEYKTVLLEIEKLEESLSNSLSEVIQSCQRRLIHVDNPSLDVKLEEEEKRSKIIKGRYKKRVLSREILFKHLESIKDEAYKPPKLNKLSENIAKEFFEISGLKEKIAKVSSDILTYSNFSTSRGYSMQIEDPEQRENYIKKIQRKKKRMLKFIEERERVIRCEVLEHIFNNYQEIKEEVGGSQFLDKFFVDEK
jgi:GTPase SAR1 family protein